MNGRSYILSFFRYHPLFLPSLASLMGISLGQRFSCALLIPLVTLSWIILPIRRQLLILCGIFFISYGYGFYHKTRTPPFKEPIDNQALYCIQQMYPSYSHGKKKITLKGTILRMGKQVQNLPCTISYPAHLPLPLYTQYLIPGTLSYHNNRYIFSPSSPDLWQQQGWQFSIPLYRMYAKQWIHKIIHRYYPDPVVASFFAALILGLAPSPLLQHAFQKLGLQHILAISGFHFALLALCLTFCLRPISSAKTRALILIISMSIYCLLVGPAPSVIRAYLMILLYLIATFFHHPLRPINLFSASLIIELFFFPRSVFHVGFQLSFLATFAILCGLPFINRVLHPYLPLRHSSQLLLMHPIERAAGRICGFFRSLLTVNLAVNMLLIPVCLFLFSSFPWGGVIYNFFIPSAVSLCCFMFFLSLPLLFVPSIFSLISNINTLYTGKMLQLLTESPPIFSGQWCLTSLHPIIIVGYITVASGFYIIQYQKEKS